MNRLLQRQIKKYFGDPDHVPPEFLPLFKAIERSYNHFEEDRLLIERAMDISSDELNQANKKLHEKNQIQQDLLQRLKDALNTLLAGELSHHSSTQFIQDENDILKIVDFIEIQSKLIKHAEEKQTDLIDRLTQANQELKHFAYIVSHDLKAPVRGIESLATWFEEDYRDLLDEEGMKLLSLMRQRVKRMHNLITGILDYCHVEEGSQAEKAVDAQNVLMETWDSLTPPKHISLHVASPLPVIRVNETHLRQIFQNLLSNAIKYIDKPEGKIDVSATKQEDLWAFSVQDNGPGIDPIYHEKIFMIFQTLNTKDEADGTGVGLSIVKKIVEKNKGTITLTSKEGKGCTFTFTIKENSLITNK